MNADPINSPTSKKIPQASNDFEPPETSGELEKKGNQPQPAIRTMKSDTEELFKNTRPTLLQMIGPLDKTPSIRRPQTGQKRYYLWAITILLILGAGISSYFIFFKPGMEEKMSTGKLIPPAPYFSTETSRTVTVKIKDRQQFLRLMQDSVGEKERNGSIKRILIKLQDGSTERFATLADFLAFYRITPPEGFLTLLDSPLMTFIYYSKDGSRLGWAIKTADADRTLLGLLSWEPGLIIDFQSLFFDEKPEDTLGSFEDRTYRNIDWRFIKLSQNKDFGIGYTIFPARNILAVTFSKEEMETTINRLFEAR